MNRLPLHLSCLPVGVACALAAAPSVAHAATVTVNTTTPNQNGDGKCGLVEAVRATNQSATFSDCIYTPNGQSDKIVVPSGTYPVPAELGVTRSVEISGAGQTLTIIDSGGFAAITFTGDGTPNPTLTLRNLTVQKSATQSLPVMGVYVNSDQWIANVVLDGVRVRNCSSPGIFLTGGLVYANIMNSVIENNNTGIRVEDTSLQITGTTIQNNGTGIDVYTTDASKLVSVTSNTIRNNISSGDGAGLYFNYAGSGSISQPLVDVVSSVFSGNQAGGNGGGVYANADIDVQDSTFDNNSATAGGGGLYITQAPNLAPQVHVRGTTFKNNRAAQGAGIHLAGGNSTGAFLYLYQSTIGPGNVATGDGGGVYSTGQIGTGENLTITGNQAARGGGIFHNSGGETHFFHMTVASNRATQSGGGGGVWLQTGNPIFSFNLLADNRAGSGTTPPKNNVFTTNTGLAGWYCLIDDRTGSTGMFPTVSEGGTNIVGVNPQLGPLTNLGGLTSVLPLQGGSPAIDVIPAAASDLTTVDQRGQTRPIDGNFDGSALPDIGAVEARQTSSALFQAETMTVAAKSSESLVVESNAGYSGGAGSVLQANSRGASSPFVTYQSGTISPGTYGVTVRFKKASNAAKFSLAVGSSATSLATLGPLVDAYRSSVTWTAVSMGTITVSTSGTRFFRFSADAKNSASTAYWMYIDSIRLVKTN